jgi:hypothetical protein
MSIRKNARNAKRQLGQFMTPPELAARICEGQPFTNNCRVLEPSFGDGSFLLTIIEKLMKQAQGTAHERFVHVMCTQVFGVEIDPVLYQSAIEKIEGRWEPLPIGHNLFCGDFFKTELEIEAFDLIIGNPPFGGTFDPEIEDALDSLYGKWNGHNLKKETYSFFIARSLDLLVPQGKLIFIASDTFLTISTMVGLRHRLADQTEVEISQLTDFSDETVQPMVVLSAKRQDNSDSLLINGVKYNRKTLSETANFSWCLPAELIKYFDGPTLNEYITCTSGMTVGKNEYFIRSINDGQILEPFSFTYFDDPVTLAKETARARLNKLSDKAVKKIKEQEAAKESKRNVTVSPLPAKQLVTLPNPDYQYYNKADSAIIYSPPKWAIFWKNEGDAVLTFKKNGNWYLHGVGGKPYFKKEGFTWQLIAPSLRVRYLPPGYILDSGAPCGFLKEGIPETELWFIIGWLQTKLASRILKTVINHTRNIQSKDVEKLPYPWWVDQITKHRIAKAVKNLIAEAQAGRTFMKNDPEIISLEELFEMRADGTIAGSEQVFAIWEHAGIALADGRAAG